MSRRGGPPARRQQSSHPGPLLGGRRHPQSRETGARSLQAAGRQSLSSKGPEPFGVSAGSIRGARVGVHHNLGGAQLWVSAALGEGGSQGATDHPGARSPGLRGERPGPLEGAGGAVRLCGHRGLTPRPGLTPRLTSGGGAAVQEFGVSWESRGGGEDGSGRRSQRPGPQTRARLQTFAEEWAGARPSPPELSAQGTRPGAAGEEGQPSLRLGGAPAGVSSGTSQRGLPSLARACLAASSWPSGGDFKSGR